MTRSRRLGVTLVALLAVTVSARLTHRRLAAPQDRFDSPEAAVQALIDAAQRGRIDAVIALFGPDGQALVDTSDLAAARQNAETFTAAAAEGWRLADAGPGTRELVVGNEGWPFPVPLVESPDGWRFDTAAGTEEILARRIGRNELAAIRTCRTYVAAQQVYAERPHDGRGPGVYARAFRSDPGRQNGLYWPVAQGQKRSPLGELVASAETSGQPIAAEGHRPLPFHGYYFRILTGQGPAAPGGARDYVVDGVLSGGFALVAWPAEYDVTGVMTFIVNHQGEVWEKDLGPETSTAAAGVAVYDPDASWTLVEP